MEICDCAEWWSVNKYACACLRCNDRLWLLTAQKKNGTDRNMEQPWRSVTQWDKARWEVTEGSARFGIESGCGCDSALRENRRQLRLPDITLVLKLVASLHIYSREWSDRRPLDWICPWSHLFERKRNFVCVWEERVTSSVPKSSELHHCLLAT